MNAELSNIAEPEETIESTLVALLAESVDIPVEGVLAPAEEGEVKRLSSETVITVAVDQTSRTETIAVRASPTPTRRASPSITRSQMMRTVLTSV